MRFKFTALLITASFVLTACGGADSPEKNQERIAEARQDAAKKVADAQESAEKTRIKAQSDLSAAAKEAEETMRPAEAESARDLAQADYEVEITKAHGEMSIAAEKCRILTGDARKACQKTLEDNYQAALDSAKAKLERAKASADQHEE